MLEKVLIIANPTAGKEQAMTYANELKSLLETHHQSKVAIRETQQSGDAVKWAADASNAGYDTVICFGGDGTVAETVNGLLQNDKRPDFAFIPLGTVNDLGRALGYAMDPETAIARFKNVHKEKLDVAQINDDIFINVVALGPIAQKVMDTSPEDKSRLGAFAYIKDGLQAFFSTEAVRLRIESGKGESFDIETNLLLVGLTNSVGGVEFMFPEATYNDGLLHLAAIKGNTPLNTLQAGVEIGLNQINEDNLLKLSDKEFVITGTSEGDIQTNVDGDPGPSLPLKLRILPKALNVLVYDQIKKLKYDILNVYVSGQQKKEGLTWTISR